MAKQGRPQLIEVIPVEAPRAPGTFASGHRTAPHGSVGPHGAGAPDGDPRPPARRWWIAPAAVAAIAAVVVGAALASDSSSSHRASPSVGSAPASSPATPPVLPLVPQTPAGYAIRAVTIAPHDSASPVVRELWATHSTAQTSSWLEITAGADAAGPPTVGDSRIAVPAGIAVFQGQDDGVLTVTGPIPGGQATISSSAVSKATIGELFASMRLDHGTLVHGDARLGGMFQEIGADPPATGAEPAQAAADDGASLTVSYGAIDDTAQSRQDFDVTVGPVPPAFDDTARRFFLSRPSEVTVVGQQAVIGSDVRTGGTQSVVFQRAGLQVSISGTALRDVLLGALQSIHVATGTELAALMAVPAGAPVDTGAATAHAWVQFADGRLSNGDTWTLRAGSSDGAISAIELEAGDVSETAPVDGRDGIILTLASPAQTALVAYIPRALPGARLVVNVGGVEHEAEAVDAGGASLLAGVAFDQLTAYSAQIVGPDGRVLSSTSG